MKREKERGFGLIDRSEKRQLVYGRLTDRGPTIILLVFFSSLFRVGQTGCHRLDVTDLLTLKIKLKASLAESYGSFEAALFFSILVIIRIKWKKY